MTTIQKLNRVIEKIDRALFAFSAADTNELESLFSMSQIDVVFDF
jgi:hypothetical protein